MKTELATKYIKDNIYTWKPRSNELKQEIKDETNIYYNTNGSETEYIFHLDNETTLTFTLVKKHHWKEDWRIVLYHPEMNEECYHIYWQKYSPKLFSIPPIKFKFHEVFSLIFRKPNETNKYYINYWDMTPNHAQFIYQYLMNFIPINEGFVVALPSEQNTLLEPWKRNRFKTFGIDIKDESSSWQGDFFKLENWNAISDKKPSLIISYLPSFLLPHSKGNSKTLWFKHILKVWGKDIPMCIITSPLHAFYDIKGRMIENKECPQISQEITLPEIIGGRQETMLRKMLLFNLPSEPKIVWDKSGNIDILEKYIKLS